MSANALVASLGAWPAAAQGPVAVTGRVMRATARGPAPVPGARVTLHRIGAGSSGPIDSTAADATGRYRFRVGAPDTSAMYLATARHGGIAYFAPPVRAGAPGGDGQIEVFDTTSAPVRIEVTGRHLVVSAPDVDGRREVVEVYELQNDSVVTRIGSRERPAFVAVLPTGATNLRATQGDFTGEAVVLVDGGAGVVAPVAPGIRQLALSYTLPPASFPLRVTLGDTTAVVEVLLEEPTGRVMGDSLQALGAVTSDGRTFLRFLGRDVPAGRHVEVRLASPAGAGSRNSWAWLLGLGLTALGAIAWSLRPRRAVQAAAGTSLAPTARERELRAAIDGVDAMLADGSAAPASRDALRAYRGQLQGELDALLAPQSGAE